MRRYDDRTTTLFEFDLGWGERTPVEGETPQIKATFSHEGGEWVIRVSFAHRLVKDPESPCTVYRLMPGLFTRLGKARFSRNALHKLAESPPIKVGAWDLARLIADRNKLILPERSTVL